MSAEALTSQPYALPRLAKLIAKAVLSSSMTRSSGLRLRQNGPILLPPETENHFRCSQPAEANQPAVSKTREILTAVGVLPPLTIDEPRVQ